MHDDIPKRSQPVHLPIRNIGNRTNLVFLTVCTEDRKSILNRKECVDALLQAWVEANTWLVGRYVVMPDHVHLFCAPALWEPPPLLKWVSYWKSLSARKWPHSRDGKLWQRHFWDSQLRRGESYAEKWEYVCNNPVRAGLAASSDDWPWQGEMNVLMWDEP